MGFEFVGDGEKSGLKSKIAMMSQFEVLGVNIGPDERHRSPSWCHTKAKEKSV